MREEDKKFVSEVTNSLWSQRNINANNDVGVARIGGNEVDYINPTLVLTKDDIREATGREKVRGVVIDEFQTAFEADGYLDVSRGKNGDLILRTKTIDEKANTFTLKQLQKSVKLAGDDLTEYEG